MRIFNWLPKRIDPPVTRTSRTRHVRLGVETLETRLVPYAVSGNAWPHPELITISVVPDGTMVDGYASDLQSTFTSKFGSTDVWMNVLKKAAQVWAEQTNINFNFVTDDGVDTGTGDYQQGDPNNGDIRIGGYDFGNSTLAEALMPPPANNWAIAGDIVFNTGQTFNIGQAYDLFTVASHEIGHSLGLDHGFIVSIMSPIYAGTLLGVTTDDINGIRNIYSANAARAKDAFDAVAANETFATAKNITTLLDTTNKTGLVENMDLTTRTDVDWYKFTVPAGSTTTLTARAVATGLSLLAPKIDIYNSSNILKATNTGVGYGSTASASFTGIAAGQTWYVKVSSVNSVATFKTGKYALVLNMGTGADPSVTLPNTQELNGDPITTGGGEALEAPQGHGRHGFRGPHLFVDGSVFSALPTGFWEHGLGSSFSANDRPSILAAVNTLNALFVHENQKSDLLHAIDGGGSAQTVADDDLFGDLADRIVAEVLEPKRGLAPRGSTG